MVRITEATKQKMRESWTEERIAKHRLIFSGERSPNKKLSKRLKAKNTILNRTQEERAALKEIKQRYWNLPGVREKRGLQLKGKTSRQILQFSLTGNFIKEWPSVGSIREAGIIDTNFFDNLQKRTPTAKNFIWKYKDEKYVNKS